MGAPPGRLGSGGPGRIRGDPPSAIAAPPRDARSLPRSGRKLGRPSRGTAFRLRVPGRNPLPSASRAVRPRSFPFPLRREGPGGDPGRQVRGEERCGAHSRPAAFHGDPGRLGRPVPGRVPPDDRSRSDPSGKIFPEGVQLSRAGGPLPRPPHRVALRSSPPAEDPGTQAPGGIAAFRPGGKRTPFVHRPARRAYPPPRASRRRRVHFGCDRRGVRPRLEKSRGGAYSGAHGGARRSLSSPTPIPRQATTRETG